MILVGELRDLDTISTALTAAETGHLVFATLHTLDAPSTIDRIIDVFPPNQQDQIRIQLAASLQGVVTQQLVPTADGQGRAVAPRSWSARRQFRTSSVVPRPTRSIRSCRPAASSGCRRWTKP